MNTSRKIKLTFISLFLFTIGWGQSETYLQAFSSPVLLHPGLAGLDQNTNFHTGNQYYFINNEKINNLFFASFDTHSKKLKGGLSFAFQHGTIGEKNTNITELAMSYSGFEIKQGESKLRFLLHAGVSVANKNWFSALLDGLFLEKGEEPSPPGRAFNQYVQIKPGTGFLYRYADFCVGAWAYVPFKTRNDENGNSEGFGRSEEVPFSLSFYLARKVAGFKRGVKSQPQKISPELIVFYNDEFVLSRAQLTVNRVAYKYGAFVQSDFTNKIHNVGAPFGYHMGNICISVNAGAGLPGVSDEIGLNGELALSLLIPPVLVNKRNPFAPPRK